LVPLEKIEINRSTQARGRENADWVRRLVEVLDGGGKFADDPELYFDGDRYWVGDGFHRLHAYKNVVREKVWAIVREGTLQDAMLHAAGANDKHGLPRSRQDIRRAISLVLKALPKLSDRSVGRIVRCDGKTVADVRDQLGMKTGKREYTDRYGNVTQMDVSGQQNREKRPIAFSVPANSFHQLPVPVRDALKTLLRAMQDLSKENVGYVRTWIDAELPDTPKKIANKLTELDMEEETQDRGDFDDDTETEPGDP
jgi:hypothetical protein